jgi:hypothetical protein
LSHGPSIGPHTHPQAGIQGASRAPDGHLWGPGDPVSGVSRITTKEGWAERLRSH